MIGIATKFSPHAPAFEVARQAGFRRAELWTDAAVLSHHAEVASLARQYPFDYAFHFPNRLEQSPETIEQAVLLYRALDARALILHQPHQDRYGERLTSLEPGIRLAIENHKDLRLGEFLGILKAFDGEFVGVCLDVGNSIALLEDPMEVVEALAPRAAAALGRRLGLDFAHAGATARERGEPLQEPGEVRLFPGNLNVRDEARHKTRSRGPSPTTW